ncbi:response regulator [Cohnella hashimotonis]|uniref:Response regulator n=1 Tax=Cohnella hashimotonis TaxID=2826895 RepID=A0ABT6TDA5_9BACL|nr:response regulator [Cohnella hashimotonis]MDI4644303.1 response regulator [Cohnella hashimotonis]
MIQALIVDDESLVRKGMRLFFPWEKYGVQIAGEAANGEKALAFIRRQPVQLLLTDITMPGMSGMELIKRAKELAPAISVVILTCHQDFDFIQEALRLGAVDYIVKTQLEELDLDETMTRMLRAVRPEVSTADTAGGGEASAGPISSAAPSAASNRAQIRGIAELAAGALWTLDDGRFAAMLEKVRGASSREAAELHGALVSAFARWRECLPMYDWAREAAERIPAEPQDAAAWLLGLRGRLQLWLRRSHYSEDVLLAIVKAADLIAERRSGDVKQSEISQAVNLSKSYFSTSFRDIMRLTFTQYVQYVSVYAARDMLLLTNHPVYLIAERCGFADQRYFSKMFKELTGLLPSEYRQRHTGRV